MSDRVPNAYSSLPNNFPQAPPTQQAQHRFPQQPQQVGSQPPVVGMTNEMWQQMQYRQQQQLLQRQLQQQQQQQPQQQQQQPSGEQMHGGMMGLSLPQQQVCLAFSYPSPLSYLSKVATRTLIYGVSSGAGRSLDTFACGLLSARGSTPFLP